MRLLLLLVFYTSFSTLFWLAAMLIPNKLIGIFTNKVELIEFASNALRIYMAVICLFGIQLACQQTFVALGNAPVSLFLALLRKIILLIPLIYIMPIIINNKCNAVFLAEPIADFIAVSVTGLMFIKIFKKTMKKIDGVKYEKSF